MKIILAGAEKLSTIKLMIEQGAKSILMSYYYLKENPDEILNLLRDKGISIFLDSGAYSFMQQDKLDFEVLKKYTEDYANFILKYKEFFEVYVELDVDTEIGYDKVKELFP